jgi:hypothetical protein
MNIVVGMAVKGSEAAMAVTNVCLVCGQSDDADRLGVWFVENARALIHAHCWIAEYDAGNLHTHHERRSA